MNESTFGEYFCDDYLCTCLDKDVPYCIIVFVFFLGVWGVFVSSSVFWSSCFFIDVILLIGKGKHTITSAPLLLFPYLRKILKYMWYLVLILSRRKHTITSTPLLFFISLLKETGV